MRKSLGKIFGFITIVPAIVWGYVLTLWQIYNWLYEWTGYLINLNF